MEQNSITELFFPDINSKDSTAGLQARRTHGVFKPDLLNPLLPLLVSDPEFIHVAWTSVQEFTMQAGEEENKQEIWPLRHKGH